MIKTLQKKFIKSAMLAVTILLIGAFGAVNMWNAVSIYQDNINLLDSLLKSEKDHDDIIIDKKISDDKNEKKPHDIRREPKPQYENVKKYEHYFIAFVDSNNEIIEKIYSSETDFSPYESDELVNAVISSQKSSGRIDKYRYVSKYDIETKVTKIAFLNISLQIYRVLKLIMISICIVLCCWLTILLLVIFLSKKAINPISENIDKQKQFVLDAGHEIKTPLAIILANTEAVELYNGESKWTNNIKEQIERLTGLTEELLSLAKADEEKSYGKLEKCNISLLTENACEMFRESFLQKNITYNIQIENDIYHFVYKDYYIRLVSILCENAVKYALEDTEVTVNLRKIDKKLHFDITNQCDALPDCIPNKLFDRFFRGDLARTQKNGGYGIGLSSAKSIVEAHGGDITAIFKDENTITFSFVL